MSDTNQSDFKTLLEEEREKGTIPPTRTPDGVSKAWWKREKSHWNSCPHVEDFVCEPSKKYRPLGPFACSGSWHQGCQIFLLVKRGGDDPAVLALEG